MTNGTRTGRRKRRALKVALGLATTLFLVLVSLPVWFPWLLAPVLNFYGLSYERYQRTGYTQFELHTIRGDWANTHATVRPRFRLESDCRLQPDQQRANHR